MRPRGDDKIIYMCAPKVDHSHAFCSQMAMLLPLDLQSKSHVSVAEVFSPNTDLQIVIQCDSGWGP